MTRLSLAQVDVQMKRLSRHWFFTFSRASIVADWQFDNFHQTMSFVNAVGQIAIAENHHPQVECGYGYCRIRYTTTDVGGLSEHDFNCAAKIDAIPRT